MIQRGGAPRRLHLPLYIGMIGRRDASALALFIRSDWPRSRDSAIPGVAPVLTVAGARRARAVLSPSRVGCTCH